MKCRRLHSRRGKVSRFLLKRRTRGLHRRRGNDERRRKEAERTWKRTKKLVAEVTRVDWTGVLSGVSKVGGSVTGWTGDGRGWVTGGTWPLVPCSRRAMCKKNEPVYAHTHTHRRGAIGRRWSTAAAAARKRIIVRRACTRVYIRVRPGGPLLLDWFETHPSNDRRVIRFDIETRSYDSVGIIYEQVLLWSRCEARPLLRHVPYQRPNYNARFDTLCPETGDGRWRLNPLRFSYPVP